MDLTILQYILIIFGGFMAGAMNTLAGYGSLVTLSLLMDVIGLPPTIANATNRVNVFAQCSASSYGYYKHGKIDFRANLWIIGTILIGAILGVITVLQVSNEEFKSIFKFLVFFLLLVILINPKRWMREESEISEINIYVRIIAFFLLGFYGGFIQMGMGIFFLAIMIFLEKSTLIQGNALKVTVIALYTIIVLAIFQYNGLIYWKAGLLIAIGQSFGGYITAKYASNLPNANKVAYYVLVTVVVAVIIYQFGVK